MAEREHDAPPSRCWCGSPERLPDGSWRGEPVVGHEGLYRLTDHERAHAGRDLYCLKGLSHWVSSDFLYAMAVEQEQEAAALRAAEAFIRGSDPRFVHLNSPVTVDLSAPTHGDLEADRG